MIRLIWCIVLCAMLLAPGVSIAAQTPVVPSPITAETIAQADVPNGVEVSAVLDFAFDEIARIDLLTRAANDTVLHLTPVTADAIVRNDGGTSVSAYIDMLASPLPIGIDLVMRWSVTTADGRNIDSSETVIPWIDDRFDWSTSSSTTVTVHHYALSDQFASDVVTAAVATVTHMRDTYGIDLDAPIDIWVYDSTSDFRGTLAANTREAVAGVSYPGFGVVHVVLTDGNTREVGRTVTHEVAHQVVACALGDVGTIPLWFDEGIATHAQSEGTDGYLPLAVYAVTNGKRFSLASLDGSFPYIASDAAIAYAISWSTIAMIDETWSPEATKHLLQAFGNGMPAEDALQTVLGITIAELDSMLDAWLLAQSSS